jgi:hypothetical protein
VSRLRTAIRAEGLLGFLRNTVLDAPILPRKNPRWERLPSGVDRSLSLRDRFRGALIGGAIGVPLGWANEGVGPSTTGEWRIPDYQPWHG